jgi:hypothetical protein
MNYEPTISGGIINKRDLCFLVLKYQFLCSSAHSDDLTTLQGVHLYSLLGAYFSKRGWIFTVNKFAELSYYFLSKIVYFFGSTICVICDCWEINQIMNLELCFCFALAEERWCFLSTKNKIQTEWIYLKWNVQKSIGL